MNPIDKVLKSIVTHLRGRSFLYPKGQSFHFLSANYKRTLVAIRGFYLMSFVVALSNLVWWWPQLQQGSFQFPLWPFFGMQGLMLAKLVTVICFFWVLGSALALYRPEKILFRIVHALGIFYFIALVNSDGLFSHSRHGLMWVSLIFVFIPFRSMERPQRADKYKLIQGFWFAQFFICTFYLMTGLWKIISIGECLVIDEVVCELGPKILTNIAAQEMFEYQNFVPWGKLFFDYPWLGFLSYLGTMWIHIASMHYAFRLDQHLIFGALRVIFHLGTFLFFGVMFNGMTACVAILFLASPFTHSNLLDSTKVFLRTPLIGDFFALFRKEKWYHFSEKVSESVSSVLLLRSVYAIICYQFCRDALWGWRDLYKDVEEFRSFIFLFSSFCQKWIGIIDIVLLSTIFSSLLAALFPRKLLFRALVAISAICFLSFYHFQLRGAVSSLGYIGVLLLLVFYPVRPTRWFYVWKRIFISILVLSICGYNYLVWKIWLTASDYTFANSFVINLVIEKYPYLFFFLLQAFYIASLLLIVKDCINGRGARASLLAALIFASFLLIWKLSGAEFFLPLLLIVFYLDDLKTSKALGR